MIFFEEFIKDEKKILNELEQYLGVTTGHYNNFDFHVLNKSYSIRVNYIHLCAVGLNRKLNVMLLRFPLFKRILNKIYFSLNNSNKPLIINSKEDDQLLTELYADSCNDLKEVINKFTVIGDLPSWLS